MSDGLRDLGIPADRLRIFTHVGVIVSLASVIEARIVQLAAWLVKPEDQMSLRREWGKTKRTALDRRRLLSQALPYGWKQGFQLVEACRRVADYRNRLGHGSLDIKIAGPPDYLVSWSWLSLAESGELEVIPIDLTEFEMWEFRLRATDEALRFIVGPGRFFANDLKADLPTIDLKSSLRSEPTDQWSLAGPDNREQWNDAVQWIFPT